MRRFRLIAAFCGAGLFAISLRGQTAPAPSAAAGKITRVEAVQVALAKNPLLAAARAQVEEARAGVALATQFPDPSFQWDYEQESGIFRPHSAGARDVGLGLDLPFPSKFHLNKVAATATLDAAQYSFTQLSQTTASQTAQAYDALQVAEQNLGNNEESRKLSQDFLTKTQARYEAGTVARLDVLQAKVNLAQAGNQVIAAQRGVMIARATLNRLMGRSPGTPVEPAHALTISAALPPLVQLLQVGLHNRPEIASLHALRKGARASTKLAQQYLLPDINLTLYRNFTQGQPAAYSTVGTIAVPLFFWQHQKGEVAQAKNREIELAADQADTVNAVELDVRNSYATADTARRQAIWIRDELLPQAREAYSVAAKSYALGGSSALDLIQSKGALLDAELQYAQALGAANDAEADLERAIAAPLPTVASTTGEKNEK